MAGAARFAGDVVSKLKPKYITFDCYGTLIDFRIADAAREQLARVLDEPTMMRVVTDFTAFRRDEVLGDWKPYDQVIHDARSAPAVATPSPFGRKTRAPSTSGSRPGVRIPTCRSRLPLWPRNSRW